MCNCGHISFWFKSVQCSHGFLPEALLRYCALTALCLTITSMSSEGNCSAILRILKKLQISVSSQGHCMGMEMCGDSALILKNLQDLFDDLSIISRSL